MLILGTSTSSFLQVVGTIIVVATAIGTAWVILVSTRRGTQMRLLREDNKDLRDRDEDKTKRIEALEISEHRCHEQVSMLTEIVTGAAAVDKLALLVERYHSTNVDALKEIVRRLDART